MLVGNLITPLLAEIDVSRAISIALVGMLIVGCALLLICLFISSLPRVLETLARVWPESDEPHSGPIHPENLVADDDSVLAAIGFVLKARLQAAQQDTNSPTRRT